MVETPIPTTLAAFAIHFSTEEACAKYLMEVRWPDGFICPRCGAVGGYPLHGEVEIDEDYVGGVEEKPGRGAVTKVLVVCAVELICWTDKKFGKARVRSGRVRFRVVPNASAASLVPFVRDNVKQGSIIHTDGWQGYNSLRKEGYDYRPVTQGQGKNAKYMPHVHRIISNLKTWLKGTHHGRIDPKHLQSYLNEFTFRFNRRFWKGPAIRRALELAVQAKDRPNQRQDDVS